LEGESNYGKGSKRQQQSSLFVNDETVPKGSKNDNEKLLKII
jgi:hypothetical protein